MRLQDLFFWRRYTTKQHSKYWAGRKGGWAEYAATWNHPRRNFLVSVLKQLSFLSVFEIGCGSAPNMINLVQNMGNKQVGGVDINPEAINVANGIFQGGYFKVGSGEDLMMSDKSTDVSVTDSFLIYIGPRKIKKYLKELLRITRKYVVLAEYHSPSWWERQKLRIFSGLHAYDYKHLLGQMGFNDVTLVKVPQFEDDNDSAFRHVIIARTPTR